MKRPQITPGDWHLGQRAGADHGAIYGPKGEEVALPLGFFMENYEAKANARAIAALPALIEALEKTFASLEDAREIILDLDPDAHARTRPLSDQIANARSALRLAGYEF